MALCRCMLMACVVLIAYCLSLTGAAMPWLAAAYVVCLFGYLAKHGHKRLTTLGSARWADANDLGNAGMLDARSGLILGRLTETRRHFVPALKTLFNRQVDAMTACRQFFAALRKPGSLLVKLNAVH